MLTRIYYLASKKSDVETLYSSNKKTANYVFRNVDDLFLAWKLWNAEVLKLVMCSLFFLALNSAAHEQCTAAVAFNLVTFSQSRNELYFLFKRKQLLCWNTATSGIILAVRHPDPILIIYNPPRIGERGPSRGYFISSFIPISGWEVACLSSLTQTSSKQSVQVISL